MVLYARYLSGRRALLSAARAGLFVDPTSATVPPTATPISRLRPSPARNGRLAERSLW